MNRVLFDSKLQNWRTPKPFFDWVNAQFGFTIDVAAEKGNALLRKYWTKEDNAFRQDWTGHVWWLNPEYDEAIRWMERSRHAAAFQASCGVNLVPARPDTKWWRHFVMNEDKKMGRLLASRYVPESRVLWLRWEGLVTGIYHHDKRLKFGEPPGKKHAGESAPFPSALIMHFHPTRLPATFRRFHRPGAFPLFRDSLLVT